LVIANQLCSRGALADATPFGKTELRFDGKKVMEVDHSPATEPKANLLNFA